MSDGPDGGWWDEGWKCPRLEYTEFQTRDPVVRSRVFYRSTKRTAVYGRFAHKDDPLQVSTGWPAPTISSTSCLKHQIIVYIHVLLSYVLSSVLFFLQDPKYDFVTLYVIFPQMYVVVTCNCATYLYAFFTHSHLWKMHINQAWGQVLYLYLVLKYSFSTTCTCTWSYQIACYLYLYLILKYLNNQVLFQVLTKYFPKWR